MDELGKLLFRELTDADEQQAVDAHQTLLAEDFEFLPAWTGGENWADYVYRMNAGRRGEHIPEGWVRSALFIAVDRDGWLLGRVSVRYELNASLEHLGGHIGYGVLPEARRQGVAAALCRFGLDELRAAGVDRALVTCAAGNSGSRATILGCGAVPDTTHPEVVDGDGTTHLRFWVPTA
ncbi:GNAT family N-acetyltransferase [Glutamicibacter protophormiae]|uniref:Acetyltransferase n=1 Tax=Glutamicibacter protophormiae TaxID=37930 RepID=A0ABS4XUP0_GLUPR|nr:GNAT family N-acetyltransferase [Glutamicibacter protophormiae]MBP2400234.1 putative acetyltransferase [Glutamicibacter protophormiae]GGL74206.1 hypothetical protein GCM10010038_00280 [Glutamicibacter protophormiae]